MRRRSTNRVPLIIEREAQPAPPTFDRSEALLRLLLGALLEGRHELLVQLRNWDTAERVAAEERAAQMEAAAPPANRLSYLALGALFRGQRRLRRRVARASRMVEQFTRPLGRQVQQSWLYELCAAWIEVEVERLVAEGRVQEQQARVIARRTLGATIDNMLLYLSDNENVDRLVNAQVTQLEDNPHVERLADDILDHFVENPEPVRRLVQQQTGGLTVELREEIRERAVTLDMFAESIVRRLLGRKPRHLLPLPPERVRARAVHLHPEQYD